MVSPTDQSPSWDFTAVYSLLHTLSANDLATPIADFPSLPLDLTPTNHENLPPLLAIESELLRNDEDRPQTLGNFDRIWAFLGASLDAPPPKIVGQPDPETQFHIEQLAPIIKGVRWRDELDGADLEDKIEQPRLSKSEKRREKKTAKKRDRKAAAQLAGDGTRESRANLATLDLTTDASSDEELRNLQRSPDRRAVIQRMLYGSSPPTSTSPPKRLNSLNPQAQAFPPSTTALFDWKTRTSHSGVSTDLRLQPLVCMTSAERKAALIRQLVEHFAGERHLLITPSLSDPNFNSFNLSPTGIHVFVDLSNILIGFHDAMKVSRQIPLDRRVKRIPLSFHSLSIILERGRPACKRVLVGSDQLSLMIAEAKIAGYETNILHRVHKAKELTARQKLYSSGSDTASKRAAPEKWVEQGVDEILHLKMLESIVDASSPSTIVLATGDAAEAEYSGGFLKMVERALERGWSVELVSFKQNTSYAYKKKEFREKWQGRFKTIELDPFVESLFGE